jgi:hypothetical protein
MSANYKTYEFFYVNGSSHSAGGGFENHSQGGYWAEQMFSYYKENYNVEWYGYEDVNWGARLSQLIGIPCHNHAAQGGGLDRAIRMTYEFIESNWDQRANFFIILELPDQSRVDVYYKPWQKYFIMNDDQDTGFKYATPNYFPVPHGTDILQEDFKFYYDTFHNRIEHYKSNERQLVGLYSFCKRANIAIKLMDGNRSNHYKNHYDISDIISYPDNRLNLINWAMDGNKQIKHETNSVVPDGHPGYFAHIEYAKLVKEWLDDNL